MAKRHANWSVVYWAKKETRSVKEKREIAKRVLREKKKEVVVMFQKKECRYDILVYGEKHVHVNLRRTGAYDAAGLFLSIKKGLS